jgi:uncharacterized membrane protein YbhN (UPF0104 family)
MVMVGWNYKRVLKWAVVIAIFVFFGKMVWGQWKEVRDASFTLKAFPFASGTLIFAFSYFIQLWAWYLITLRLGIALSFSETLGSWFYSQMGKYLPGKVWLLLSRFYFYESKGKSKKTISIGLYFEAATIIVAAGVLFWASLILFHDGNAYGLGEESRWLALLFIPVLVFLHPKVLQSLCNWFLRRLKKEPVVVSLSYGDVLWIMFVCLLSWMVGGIGFYLFIDSVYSVPAGSVLYLTGALAFSSILGLIALFAPGGLGVREGTLVYLLSFTMPGSVAVVLSVLTRLWTTLIEIGLIGVIYLVSHFRTRPKEKDHYA